MKFYFIFFLFYFSLFGCSKLKDDEKPKITVVLPKMNDTIRSNNTEVDLQFYASDNLGLSSLILEINDVSGNNYFSDTKTLHGKEYSYKNSFIVLKNTKIKPLVMKIHIQDENQNEEVCYTTFYLAP
jgi:hypothetical protein